MLFLRDGLTVHLGDMVTHRAFCEESKSARECSLRNGIVSLVGHELDDAWEQAHAGFGHHTVGGVARPTARTTVSRSPMTR